MLGPDLGEESEVEKVGERERPPPAPVTTATLSSNLMAGEEARVLVWVWTRDRTSGTRMLAIMATSD